MNGFGPRKRVSQGEAYRLEKICDRVLNDEPGSAVSLESWRSRTTRNLGGEKAWQQWFVHHAYDDLGIPIGKKFYLAMLHVQPPEFQKIMNQKAKEVFVEQMQESGFVLGKDFSFTSEGEILVSPEVSKKLEADLGSEFLKNIKTIENCPWEAVEKHLGVPFRFNLLNRLSELINQGRSCSVILAWMANVALGVTYQVVGDVENNDLSQAFSAHLAQVHPQMYEQVRLLISAAQIWGIPNLLDMDINCLLDVSIAAGSSQANGELVPNGFSRKALERLSLVWRGDERSIPELIAKMDAITQC